MKKIVIIHHSSVIGGAGISLFNLIQLIKEDYDITVYVSDLHDDYYDFLKSHDLHVKTYTGRTAALYYHAASGGVTNITFWYRLALIPFQFLFWKKIIRETRPDLVIVNSLVLSWVSVVTGHLKIKSLCFVRETFANNGKGIVNKIQRKLLSFFTGVSFISKFDLETANVSGKVKTFINHNYMGTSSLEIKPVLEKNFFSVLYLGGMSKEKGIEVVIETANILKAFPNIKFNILGEDYRSFINNNRNFNSIFNKNVKLSEKIRKRVETLNLSTNIIFHGIQNEIQSFFTECDVLICPITSPHQQRGIFEAGWYSKPVIVSDFKQLHWAVEPGVSGDFFEPHNPNDLAAKVLKLYNNRDVCLQQGKNNNLMTLENHTMDTCNVKVVSMLKNIIDE